MIRVGLRSGVYNGCVISAYCGTPLGPFFARPRGAERVGRWVRSDVK